MNKQGKVRLAKWFSTYQQKERTRITKEVASLVLPRDSQVYACSFMLLYSVSIGPCVEYTTEDLVSSKYSSKP